MDQPPASLRTAPRNPAEQHHRLRRHRRSPTRQKLAHARFLHRIALRRGVWNPDIELECSVAVGAHLGRPGNDFIGLHQQHTARSEPARIGDGDRQRGALAPAMGASRIGTLNPKRAQNASARSIVALIGSSPFRHVDDPPVRCRRSASTVPVLPVPRLRSTASCQGPEQGPGAFSAGGARSRSMSFRTLTIR